MSDDLFSKVYNPDVLSCLANLSNDEVFTSPDVVNQMLDMLPQELFSNPDTTFLDPACKTGVFLREIAKRLIKGLENQYPDLQERVDHIFHKQLYGIAITELTSLVSRRSVYCSKYPNSDFSISKFQTSEGNIRFKNVKHTFKNKKCIYCGASEDELGSKKRENLESHAYEFIHGLSIEEVFKMKFDVIISNPPYQLKTAGDDNGAQARPIYNLFVEKAMSLNPSYLVMITPSRWMTGGWNLDEFRNLMVSGNHMEEMHDFPNASDCFPGVEIKGGVSFFKWNRNYNGTCKFVTHSKDEIVSESDRNLIVDNMNTIIRYNEAVSIVNKVLSFKEESFSSIVSPMKPFGLPTKYKGAEKQTIEKNIKVYANKNIYYASNDEILKNKDCLGRYKLIAPKAVGSGDPKTDVVKAIICEKGSCCTETYIMIGPFNNENECNNALSYINTKFFHFMLTLRKDTQDCLQKTYIYVPMQDFTNPWDDKKLFSKYGLSTQEIDFINNLIWPEEK